jgi:hypothetical protein
MKIAQVLLAVLMGAFFVNAQLTRPTPDAFVAAPGQKFYLDLDTAEGRFSQWRHDDLGTLNALHASIRIPRVRKDPRWAPSFMIAVQNTEPGRRRMVALQILSLDRKPPFSLRVIEADDGKIKQTESFSSEPGFDQTIEVEINWATRNLVVVTVGSQVHRISVDWPIDNVAVTSSTGQLKADPIVFGQSGK